jgi:SAM-dependent methyltransferase
VGRELQGRHEAIHDAVDSTRSWEMAESTKYVMGGTLGEQQRLLAQAAEYDGETRWLLDQVGIQPGWRAADMGCGPIGILDRLAERVGATGRVVGVEREARFVDMARALIAERDLRNVEVVAGDATATGLPAASFDCVHERLTLLQQPVADPLLREMVRLTRPGGVIALQDIDAGGWLCEPPHPAWSRLTDAFLTVCREHGMDVHLGRRLAGLLRSAGLEDVDTQVHVRLKRPGEHGRADALSLVNGVRGRVIERGLLSEGEFAEQTEALQKHLDRPETIVVGPLLFQAWGRKPG